MHPTQIENRTDLAHGMIVWHRLIEAKRIEKLFLVVIEPPHHGPLPSRIASQRRNHQPKKPATDFCNKIGHKQTSPAFIRSPRRRARSTAGNVKPAVLAVFRLTISSYLVGA